MADDLQQRMEALDRLLDGQGYFDNFKRPPAEDIKRHELRQAVADYVRECPGQTLTEIAKAFNAEGYKLSREQVHTTLKHHAVDPDTGLPPIAVKVERWTEGEPSRKYETYGWKFASDADEVSEYIRACLGSTLGDIYSLAGWVQAVEYAFGDGSLGSETAVIWDLWSAAEQSKGWDA